MIERFVWDADTLVIEPEVDSVKLAKEQSRVPAGSPEGGEFGEGDGNPASGKAQAAKTRVALTSIIRHLDTNEAMGKAVEVLSANHMNPAVIAEIGRVNLTEKPSSATAKQLAAGEDVVGMYTSSGGTNTIWLNPKGGEVEGGKVGTAIHEFGHHVYDRMTQGDGANEGFRNVGWNEGKFEAAHEAANKEYAKVDAKAWKVVTREGHTMSILRPGAEKSAITAYAMTNLDEWHAEAFRVYHQGGKDAERMQRIAPKTYDFWKHVSGKGF